jgi:riboflavin kinase/FMN adenylyltransferase
VSSTNIRKALLQANVSAATELLGYDYFFQGRVVEGNKLGRTLGYPTANIGVENPEKLIPGNGVYAVTVDVSGVLYKGMMNIGIRPTVDTVPRRVIEVNLFDFDNDLYGAIITVYVKKFLRAEQKFAGLDALKDQLAKDKTDAINALGQP